MSTTVQHYTSQRAALLANLVLTRRKDVQVVPLGEHSELGLDLIAHTTTPITGLPVNPYFGVHVKGTDKQLDGEPAANKFAKQVVRGLTPQSFVLAPIVLMVFSIEDDKGYWGWVTEPFVDEFNTPLLQRVEKVHTTEIDTASVDRLITRVVEWFEAMGKVLRGAKSASGQ